MIHATDAGPDVTIRPMRREEAAAVGRLTLRSYDAHGRFDGPYRHYLADPLQRLDGATELLVAERHGELVGTVTFVLPTDRAWEGPPRPPGDAAFRVLAVAPSMEGAGVGRALVTRCIDLARADGRHRLFITSMAWMRRAHELYRRAGFERRPDLDVRFPGGIGWAFTYDVTDEAPRRFDPPGPVPYEPPWFEDAWRHPRADRSTEGDERP